jgi:hypothetical protein
LTDPEPLNSVKENADVTTEEYETSESELVASGVGSKVDGSAVPS